eukprot:m.161334 g.161334  ORF g.161334 m.161334 type:complete len:401 (-) comp12060_c1_seq1:36-1238(-)
MSFAFNFGGTSDETDGPTRGDRRNGKDDTSRKPKRQRQASPPQQPIVVLALPSTASMLPLPPRSGQLTASFANNVVLRGVSSELATNEIAAFGASETDTDASLCVADDSTSTVQGTVTQTNAHASSSPTHHDEDSGGACAHSAGTEMHDGGASLPVVQAESAASDLIPRVYEGGMKVWEGTGDLVNHLILSGETFRGQTVLELGAGAGLPGIYAATQGARRVDFQDYNREVIEHVTIPNYRINLSSTSDTAKPSSQQATPQTLTGSDKKEGGTLTETESPQFFAGSWAALEQHFVRTGQTHTYDLVLTAETLYSLESMPELYAVLKSCVATPDGVAYVASKTYYFGVGGGTRDFLALVERDGYFEASTVFEIGGGVKREVIQLRVAPSKSSQKVVSNIST